MNNRDRETLKLCLKLSDRYRNDFIGFVKETISFEGLKHKELTEQQKVIATHLIADRNLCVSAGGGIGKSALAALFVIWFILTHPYSKIPTTAPSRKQLKDVLWAEIAFWLRRCKYGRICELLSEKLYIKGFDDWCAVARTVPKEGNAQTINDTLAGFHGKGDDDLLIIVDEASGVPDPVFTALEGAMTSGAYILLISNPVSTGGYYYDTISDPEGKGKDYKVLFFDSRESPLVDKNFEARIIARYGKDSPMYISKVLGRPIALVESSVVSPETYDRVTQANRLRYSGEVVLSIDVGGVGKDPAVFCHKSGNSIIRWDTFYSANTQDLADEAVKMYTMLYKGRNFKCICDGVGTGAGTVDALKRRKMFPVIPFIGSEKANNSAMYKIKRAEGYYELSKNFDQLHFPAAPPKRLKKELCNLFFDFSNGPIEMEPKKKFVSRLGMSPDHADALMMACSVEIAGGIPIRPFVPKKRAQGLKILGNNQKFKQRFQKFLV